MLANIAYFFSNHCYITRTTSLVTTDTSIFAITLALFSESFKCIFHFCLLYLRGREKETEKEWREEVSYPLNLTFHNSWEWAWPKLGAQNSQGIFPVGGRDPAD